MNKIEKYIPTQEDIASAYKSMDEKQMFLSNSREHILKSLESNKDRTKIEDDIIEKINKLENEKDMKIMGSSEMYLIRSYLNQSHYEKLKENISSQDLPEDGIVLTLNGTHDHETWDWPESGIYSVEEFCNPSKVEMNWEWEYFDDAQFIGKKPSDDKELANMLEKIYSHRNGGHLITVFLEKYPEYILSKEETEEYSLILMNNGQVLKMSYNENDTDRYQYKYELYSKDEYANNLKKEIDEKEFILKKLNNIE